MISNFIEHHPLTCTQGFRCVIQAAGRVNIWSRVAEHKRYCIYPSVYVSFFFTFNFPIIHSSCLFVISLNRSTKRQMAAKFDPTEILNTRDVCDTLVSLALELSLLGHVDEARSLFSVMNSNKGVPNSNYHRRPLRFDWDITESWPNGEALDPKETISQMRASF